MAKKGTLISVKPGALKGTSLIVTGDIPGQSRKSAQQILINAGATIEKSLNKKVQLVVLGEKPGPDKLTKIEDMGIETKEWDDLMEEIKGEGANEPAADEGEDDKVDEEEVEEKPKPSKAKPKAKANTKAKTDPVPKVNPAVSLDSPIAGKTVVVTGVVPGHDRKSAQVILENAGASVAKSLNKQVELVILGTNPGPDKLKKIEELGIQSIQWNDLAENLGIDVTPEKEVADVKAGDAPDSISGMTLIITGTIDGQTRTSAQEALEGVGAKFAKSLNKSVELAILGTNPGPDKLNKIADLGIATCSWDTLIEKLGLEITDEPPKKKAKKV